MVKAKKIVIDKNITIEDLVTEFPKAVSYLMDQGIRCMRCGEPIWGTLETASLEKGFNQKDISRFVKELKMLAED